jgi:hypothetical protein
VCIYIRMKFVRMTSISILRVWILQLCCDLMRQLNSSFLTLTQANKLPDYSWLEDVLIICCIPNCLTHVFLLSFFLPDSLAKTLYSRKAETKKDDCVIEKVSKTKINLDYIVYLYVCIYIRMKFVRMTSISILRVWILQLCCDLMRQLNSSFLTLTQINFPIILD